MHPVQKHLVDTEFSGLEGTEVEGTLALSDELINLGLLEILAKIKTMGQPKPVRAITEAEGTQKQVAGAAVDPQVMLKKLRVDRLNYRTEQGTTMVDFKVGFGEGRQAL